MIKTPKKIGIKHQNLIKLIKTTPPRHSWWLPGTKPEMYYSSLLNDKHFIYSFLNEKSAERCVCFLNKYKQINNDYPNINVNDKLTKNYTSDLEIYIEDESIHSIKYKCSVNNANLAGITYFDYTFVDSFLGKKNVFNLSISAVDLLENEKYDKEKQILHFNYLLNC